MGALYASHYLWVIFAFQVIAGVFLIANRYVPLAVAVLAPVIVNILTFHALGGEHLLRSFSAMDRRKMRRLNCGTQNWR